MKSKKLVLLFTIYFILNIATTVGIVYIYDKYFSKGISSQERESGMNIPSDPMELFNLFKKSIFSEDYETVQKLIHTDGAFFMGEERLKKEAFVKTAFLKNNILGQIKELLSNGEMGVSDNFSHAMGGIGTSSKNPHLDLNNLSENGGQFKRGSKIVTVKHNSGTPQENSLVIELYKDGKNWRIYSIYHWEFSIE